MRNLDESFLNALSSTRLNLILLVYMDWPSGPVRAHNRIGSLTWDGHEWLGVGAFGTITPSLESRSSAAKRLTLSITGFPDKIVSDLGQEIRNREAHVYWGLIDDNGELIGSPDLLQGGIMNGRRFTITAENSNQVSYGLSVDIWNGASPRRPGSSIHSFDDQVAENNGDTAARHLVNQAESVILWPA